MAYNFYVEMLGVTGFGFSAEFLGFVEELDAIMEASESKKMSFDKSSEEIKVLIDKFLEMVPEEISLGAYNALKTILSDLTMAYGERYVAENEASREPGTVLRTHTPVATNAEIVLEGKMSDDARWEKMCPVASESKPLLGT